LHGFAAQGLQGFFAAQGLHGFFAARGFAALAAHGLHGFLAAQGLAACAEATIEMPTVASVAVPAKPSAAASGKTGVVNILVLKRMLHPLVCIRISRRPRRHTVVSSKQV
jgi:hypothetical protein